MHHQSFVFQAPEGVLDVLLCPLQFDQLRAILSAFLVEGDASGQVDDVNSSSSSIPTCSSNCWRGVVAEFRHVAIAEGSELAQLFRQCVGT